MRKFEFTMRHAVHEHEISKRVFVFPRHESIERLLENKISVESLSSDDFVEVELRGDRLASCPHEISRASRYASICCASLTRALEPRGYTEQGALCRVMLRRCADKAKQAQHRYKKSKKLSDIAKARAAGKIHTYSAPTATVSHTSVNTHFLT